MSRHAAWWHGIQNKRTEGKGEQGGVKSKNVCKGSLRNLKYLFCLFCISFNSLHSWDSEDLYFALSPERAGSVNSHKLPRLCSFLPWLSHIFLWWVLKSLLWRFSLAIYKFHAQLMCLETWLKSLLQQQCINNDTVNFHLLWMGLPMSPTPNTVLHPLPRDIINNVLILHLVISAAAG